MPANLPPQYNKVEQEYRKAATPAERLEKLREMYRLLPKHKGTEKLQSDLKQKISRARDEIDHAKSDGKRGGVSYRVPHEGAGQVVLVGAPNVGKSALLAALTKAHPEVAAYPFTTRAPQPGMMMWEDVAVQLVDLPPVTQEFFEPWMGNLVRSADAALLIADLAEDDLIDGLEQARQRLATVHVEFVHELPHDVDDEAMRHVPAILVANKLDAEGAADRLNILEEWIEDQLPVLAVSARAGTGLDDLRRATYERLGVFRVYTKAPGKPVDRRRPYTLPLGATVVDLARAIHGDLEEGLKFARVWGTGVFEGQTVKRDHELHDSDVVELHT